MTDNVCRGRRPVRRTADTPRFVLLSFLHLMGDVENRAAGGLRVHWVAGTRKAGREEDVFIGRRLGRSIRWCIAVMVSVSRASTDCPRNVCAAPPMLKRQKLNASAARAHGTAADQSDTRIAGYQHRTNRSCNTLSYFSKFWLIGCVIMVCESYPRCPTGGGKVR
jgi:hypothetical protein